MVLFCREDVSRVMIIEHWGTDCLWQRKELAKAVCSASMKKISAIMDKQVQIKPAICRFERYRIYC